MTYGHPRDVGIGWGNMKKFLLGSTAAIMAVAGAQAADLPVKAKPVEYVKVCSLYGAGFWYVPGTDTCLKIGSYVRVQTSWDAEGGGIPLGMNDSATDAAGRFTRTDTSDLAFRTRSAISVDLRTQTEYGTLRSYLEVGAELTTGSASATNAVFFDRGFIQFAGFTAGKIRSYFDVNSFAPYSYSNNRVSGDTGAAGIYGIAYTAQFGNGVTASLSLEDGGSGSNGNSPGSSGSRGHLTMNLNSTAMTPLGVSSYDNKGWTVPDVVGALRIDQAWGYAQVAAAMHDASGGYYSGASTAGLGVGCAGTPCTNFGHPKDKYGFAVTGGFTLNDVFGLKGDQVGMQGAYSVGAAGYVTRATGAFQVYGSNNSVGVGWVSDGVFDNITPNCPTAGTCPSNVELTTVWGINGFYQHFWNPKWRTSLYGGYVEVDYDAAAANLINQHLPSPPAGGTACGMPVEGIIQPPLGVGTGTGNSCSPNFSWWQVGTRTQWNPHPDLDIGVDVLWTHLNTAYKGLGNPTAVGVVNGVSLSASGARPTAIATVEDQDVLSVLFRVQRNFLP
jgi:Porin subfamily